MAHISPYIFFCLFSGVHLQAECSYQAEGAAHAPQQHQRGGGHGDLGGPSRWRHHAQPLPALPAETHLCKFPESYNTRNDLKRLGRLPDSLSNYFVNGSSAVDVLVLKCLILLVVLLLSI